jgi:hypothetical protein
MATNTVKSFRDGVLKLADAGGTSGDNVINVAVGDGGLSWREEGGGAQGTPQAKMDRGALDHWIPGEQVPVTFTIEAEDRGLLGAAGTPNASTLLYEAVNQQSSASDWVTDDPNGAVYSFQIELTITDPGDDSTLVVLFENAVKDTYDYNEDAAGNRFTLSGRALMTKPGLT